MPHFYVNRSPSDWSVWEAVSEKFGVYGIKAGVISKLQQMQQISFVRPLYAIPVQFGPHSAVPSREHASWYGSYTSFTDDDNVVTATSVSCSRTEILLCSTTERKVANAINNTYWSHSEGPKPRYRTSTSEPCCVIWQSNNATCRQRSANGYDEYQHSAVGLGSLLATGYIGRLWSLYASYAGKLCWIIWVRMSLKYTIRPEPNSNEILTIG